MTWPFENDTNAITKKLADRSLAHEQRRNLFAVIALALTSFMITATFSIGFSYFETYRMQQIRMIGTTTDTAITNPTKDQLIELANSDLVLDVGIQERLGSVDTSQMQNAKLGLVWLDSAEWEKHRVPAISGVVGDYPEKENEVMLPIWALNQMGISEPYVGMEICLSYQLGDNYNYTSDTFILSGYYTDYISTRTDNRGYVYVSMPFRDSVSVSSGNSVSAMIRFKGNDDKKENCEKLQRRIDFTEKQEFEITPSGTANGESLVWSVILLAIFISFSGYLLVYNILYISVAKDVQFYGRLKTIGTTKKQLRKIIYKQAMQISCIGIPIGLLLGAGVSFGVVPYALNMLYSGSSDVGTKISFSPLIFIGAAVFTFITVMIASMKPAKIAGSVSPIAALRYTDVRTKVNFKKRTKVKLFKMAQSNIFRNAKSTILVFASLFSGLLLFVAVTGILHSLSPEVFVSQWGESDFAITYSIYQDEDLITDEMISEISRLDSIENLRLTYAPSSQVVTEVIYDDTVFHNYLMSLNGRSGIDFADPAQLEAYQQNFFSGIYGIDSVYLEEINKTLSAPVDMTAFERGNIVLLAEMTDANGNNLIQSGQEITIQTQNGQHSFTVAGGFLDADFQAGRGHVRGTAPDLYISQTALKELFPRYRVFRVSFDTNGLHDEDILRELKSITASKPDIEIISRYEKRKEMSSYLVTANVLGTGVSVILLLTGIMNFINTMAVNINARRHELAMLESVGMTKRQIKRMLMLEGFYYWAISLFLVVTAGTAIYIPLYQIFSRLASYSVFSYPVIPLAIVAGFVLIICLVTPILTYRSDIKNSVVERLRMAE